MSYPYKESGVPENSDLKFLEELVYYSQEVNWIDPHSKKKFRAPLFSMHACNVIVRLKSEEARVTLKRLKSNIHKLPKRTQDILNAN